jgi:hypothetical protein
MRAQVSSVGSVKNMGSIVPARAASAAGRVIGGRTHLH